MAELGKSVRDALGEQSARVHCATVVLIGIGVCKIVDCDYRRLLGAHNPHFLVGFHEPFGINVNLILLHCFAMGILALPDLTVTIVEDVIIMRRRQCLSYTFACAHTTPIT